MLGMGSFFGPGTVTDELLTQRSRDQQLSAAAVPRVTWQRMTAPSAAAVQLGTSLPAIAWTTRASGWHCPHPQKGRRVLGQDKF